MALRRPLLVLLAIATAAAAQLPPAPGPDGVEVSLAAAEVSLSVEEPATVQVHVRNTGTATGTPLDMERLVTLEVGGLPEGWTAGFTPSSLRIPPGGNATSTLQLSVATGSQARDAELTVTAKLYPRGVNAIPAVGPAVDPEATATAPLAAHRDDPFTRDVLETLGPWVYVLILLLLAAVALVVRFVVVNRRVAVAVRADTHQVQLFPGGRASVPFTVQNLTSQEDTVVFQVSAVATGWAAFVPVPELQLGPDGSEELALVVIASKDLAADAAQSILVSATSAQAPKRPATFTVEATVGGAPPPRGKKDG